MTTFIYLAGPIAGCDAGQANNWRDYVASRLPENVRGVSPLRCEPLIGDRYALEYDDVRFGTPSAISGKNWLDTVSCDMVLAYLPKELNDQRPSYGTVIELGWAIGLRKPIILVTDDDNLSNHPLIARNVSWVINNFDDALDVITGLFEVYNE